MATLTLFALACILLSFCQFQPSFFAQDIMAEFGLSTSAFTLITAFPMMIGLFLSVPAGWIADKIGLKKTLMCALAITTFGAIWRAFCQDYTLMLIGTTLLGVSATVTTATIPKVAVTWFSGRKVSLGVGIMTSATISGMGIAQAVTGILFPDFRTAFLGGGIALAVLLALWTLFARDRTDVGEDAQALVSSDEEADSHKQDVLDASDEAGADATGKEGEKAAGGIGSVVKSRGIWLAGIGNAFFNAFNITAGSLLITALVVYWGSDEILSGIAAGLFTVGMVVGSATIPTFLARTPRAKLLSILLPIAAMGLFFAGWYINDIVARCILFPLAGCCFGGITPIFLSFPSVLPEIAPENVGTAGGLLSSIQMIGAVVFPTLVITPIAGDDYNLMVIIAGLFVLVDAIIFALLPSVYRKNSETQDA